MPDPLRLEVAGRTELTPDVVRLVLRDPAGADLPGYRGGAHIGVTTPSGARRSYSLVEAGSRRPREYVVCVRRDPQGRGASVSLHDDVRVGDLLDVTWPANTFPLRRARRYLFIAGGIGITPVRAMVAELRARARAGEAVSVQVLYLTRSAGETVFLDEFSVPEESTGEAGVVHHSSSHGRLDLWPYLAEPDDEARVYVCGPPALVAEVLALTAHWRPSRVHVEDFAGVDALGEHPAPFTVVWAPSGARVEVAAERSMLAALRAAGVEVAGSCESGTCGTCRLRLLAGEVVHRDLVLGEDERARSVMPCVSRAAADGEAAEVVVAPL